MARKILSAVLYVIAFGLFVYVVRNIIQTRQLSVADALAIVAILVAVIAALRTSNEKVNSRGITAKDITIQQFVGNQVTLAQQLAFFSQQIGLTNPRQDFAKSQFESYSDVWKSLQALRLAGDDLWAKATGDNLIQFAKQLRTTTRVTREGEIFFEPTDRQQLLDVLGAFEDFQIGKQRLVDFRSKLDIERFSREGSLPRKHLEAFIADQIEANRRYMNSYEQILDKVRESFNKRLSR